MEKGFCYSNQEAKTIAEKLVKEVISRKDPPRPGTKLWSLAVAGNMCGKDQNLFIPPRKWRIVKRMNCILQVLLAKYVSDHLLDRDEHLLLIKMAYHSSVNAPMQYTPFYLLFDHELQLPVHVMFGRQSNHMAEVSDYVRNLWDTLEEVDEHVREHLLAAQKRQKDPFDQRMLESKSKLAIKYSFMTQLWRKCRLRSSTHHGKVLTLWSLGLAM